MLFSPSPLFQSFLTCSLFIITTRTHTARSHRQLVSFQFTSSGVMKDVVVLHRPLYCVSAACSFFRPHIIISCCALFVFPPKLPLWSQWFLWDYFLTAVNYKGWSVFCLLNLAVVSLLFQMNHASAVSLVSLLPHIADIETNFVCDKCFQETYCSSFLVFWNSSERTSHWGNMSWLRNNS